MSTMSLGDLAQTFMFQKRGTALRQDMTRLTNELATGQVSDARTVLAGNFSYLADIERDLRGLEAYDISAAEAAQFAGAMQTSLERMQNSAQSLSTALLTASSSTSSATRAQGALDARGRLDEMFSALNSDIAGRNLFSGTATQTNALEDVDTLLTALETAIVGAGANSAGTVINAARTWFTDPTGFDATIYTGSTTDLAPFQMSQTEGVSLGIRADDDEFKNTLMYAAVAALSDSVAIGLSAEERRQVLEDSGAALLAEQQTIVGLRASVGTAQARIDTLEARNSAQMTALEFARNQFLAVDPFDTATQLEAVQFSLQSLYTVTARSADLSLVNFIR